jgi:hypothetical protein
MNTQKTKRSGIRILAAVMSLIVVTSSCSGTKIERITVNQKPVTSSSPAIELRPGEKAALNVEANLGVNDTILWSKGLGQYVGATDKASVTYLAPQDQEGPAGIFCSITSNGDTKTVTVPIVIVKQPGGLPSSATPDAAPPEGNPAPPGAPIEAYDIERGGYIPSGWMGDGEKGTLHVNVDPQSTDQPHKGKACQKWTYRPGSVGWTAVAWQFPENNWGDKEGKDFRNKGFTRLSVWARGVPDREGNYPVIQFKAGGNTDPTKRFKASFDAAGDFVTLSQNWQQYTLPIPGKAQDLSMVISAFTWVMRARENANGATFYLSEIEFQ